MKNSLILVTFLTLFFNLKIAAQDGIWQKLASVTYKKEYNDLLGYKIDIPVFGKIVQQLEGKTITVRGYIVPTDGYKSHTEFVFSAFPYSMCFFCGQAGPETVMDIAAVVGVKFSTEPITLKGKLHLNNKDINRLMYSLSEAEIVE
jgi:hypothetical protein